MGEASPNKGVPVVLNKLNRTIARLGASVTLATAAISSMAGNVSAQQVGGITVTPTTVQTAAVSAQAGAQAYEGDAGAVTITVGANTVFKEGQPLKWEECNLDPVSQSNCDELTIQTTDPGSTTTVTPNPNGSVTAQMDLWILPTGNRRQPPTSVTRATPTRTASTNSRP